MKARTRARIVPSSHTSPSSDGNTSRPSVRKVMSCATHARPSWNVTIERFAGMRADPSTRPVRYTAKKPDPWATSARPKARAAAVMDATG
jgi:hypothetical protein